MTVEKMEPDGYVSCSWLIDGRVARGMFRAVMVAPLRAPAREGDPRSIDPFSPARKSARGEAGGRPARP